MGITYIHTPDKPKVRSTSRPSTSIFLRSERRRAERQTANVNAAKLFIEYLCSPEGQQKVAETGEFVLAPGIYPNVRAPIR